jgi:hypothetical protein
MPGTIASAPALLCRRLLHRNILLQLKTKLRDAMFRLPMTKLLQHINLPNLLLTLRQQCLPALHLKPSLGFAGLREYRWQGLEAPVMMAKRRGTAQIAPAPPTGCAAGNRHKNLHFKNSIALELVLTAFPNCPPFSGGR